MKYHKDIYFPTEKQKELNTFNDNLQGVKLHWTHHAKQRIVKIENIQYFYQWYTKLSLKSDNIIEYTTQENGKIEKVLYRLKYNEINDVLISISNKAYVLTIWHNRKTDKHNTLNTKQYQTI